MQGPPSKIYPTAIHGTPDVDTWRVASVGYLGLPPPFNSSGKPLINLAVFDSCETGSTDDFNTILYPQFNGYVYFTENQSMAGWAVKTYVADAETLADLLWGFLTGGETIGWAGDKMIYEAAILDVQVVDGAQVREVQAGDFKYYADRYTRIRDVYTGTDTDSGWWRQL